jgi:hypothetical protein
MPCDGPERCAGLTKVCDHVANVPAPTRRRVAHAVSAHVGRPLCVASRGAGEAVATAAPSDRACAGHARRPAPMSKHGHIAAIERARAGLGLGVGTRGSWSRRA